ncbi:hypothetical protein COCON_G00199510 [Conger conger]|uniref:Protein aurora borealis n=1 Tax=Conger conger TaxID=82655 RepID=A0A9Q1D213_CONCO|nr:hypothetical protein COCON_G00199510 [Conger conger]
MGDVAELQITPATPGRPTILNPFESPNDYHRLHESTVASPSLFRSRASSATPAKFKWSIDEMATLLPVDIDPEDIHRQSMYFSQNRTDTEIEEKCQNAIEQFFTNGPIVPSPWASSSSKLSTQMHILKSSMSPEIPEEEVPAGRCSAASQTVLSLPVDFDLEKVLGEHYRLEDVSEQVQDSLSSSSLRRKLFLDGIGSGSESSTPSSPDHSAPQPGSGNLPGGASVSPLRCGPPVITPTSGQFSSSPIQSRGRAYSLGSAASPLFPQRPTSGFKSPTLSPIVLQSVQTPVSGEKRQLRFVTPEGVAAGGVSAANRTESPYVEGCSPIKSSSPIRPPAQGWAPSVSQLSPTFSPAPAPQNGRRRSAGPAPPMDVEPLDSSPADRGGKEAVPMETREAGGENAAGAPPGEHQDEGSGLPLRLTSSRSASMLHTDSSAMFVSLLTDSSMQVDSGYNTYSIGTNGTIDGANSDSQTKELLDPLVPEEAFLYTKTLQMKSKMINLHH